MGIIIKNSLKATIINYIGVLIGTVSILFIQVEILTEYQIGHIRLILDKAYIILPLLLIGMDSVPYRFHFYFNKDKKEQNTFISLFTTIPFVSFLFFFLALYFYNSKYLIDSFYYISIISFSYLFILIFESFLTIKTKILYPLFLKNIVFRLLYILILTLFYFKIINFEQLLQLYSFSFFIHFLLVFFYFNKNLEYSFQYSKDFYKHPRFKDIIIFCLFLLLGSGSSILASKLDTIMLNNLTGNKGLVGIYVIAFSIATFIELPKRPIIQIASPIIAKDLADNQINKVAVLYQKSALNLMIIATMLFSLIWINIDFIFELIPNGNVYKSGKYVVFFLGLTKLVDLSFGLNAEIIHNSKYYRWNLVLLPFLTITTIALNYYFIKYSENSILGVAKATFISVFLFNLLRTILVKWKLKIQPFNKNFFLAIPFSALPFLIDYFLISNVNNIWIKMILDSSAVFIFFFLPIYLLRISSDINDIIKGLYLKYIKS